MAKGPSRRLLILAGVAAGGGLAVGFALSPWETTSRARKLLAKDGETVLTSWVRIGADDAITVIVPHADMGQGVLTSLPMMLAEELDADWGRVRVEQAPADVAFANGALVRAFLQGDRSVPEFLTGFADFTGRKLAEFMHMQITGGSTAVRLTGVTGMRRTGAAARWMLVKAAARQWDVAPDTITTRDSVLTHAASGRTLRYGEVAEAAAQFAPPDALPLKDRANYRIVGRAVPRFDVPAKCDGTAIYGGDIRLPDMLFGAVMQAPVIGGKLVSVDDAPARAMRGVTNVVTTGDAVIVVADNTWRARQALTALAPQWDDGDGAGVGSAQIVETMAGAMANGDFKVDHKVGDAEAALAGAARTIEASYRIPFLSHAQMEPLVAVAQFKDGRLDVWAGVQNPLGSRHDVAKHAKLGVDKVTLHPLLLGGGFGRRATSDSLLHAVDAAMHADGRPVQVSWTREEDMTHGFYRQASVAQLSAGLDANGRVVAWRHSFAERHDPADATLMHYAIPDRLTQYVNGLNPVRWGPWRSVDNTLHGFFIECFMDELAHAAGQDPYAFRRAHLDGRHRAVLEKAAELARWEEPAPEGRARGIAIRESFGTIVAQVAEVSIDEQGRARVHHVWSAADPGEVINPATFRAQIEGGAIYGLTAALYGEITVENGRVLQQNFPDYDMIRMADAPRQEVAIIESGAHAGGAGEPGTPAVAAAVANAVFALTGQRIRELPLRKFDLRSGERRATA
jgi:isoquinoline 1-oxidoreductase beta subunit